MLLPPSLLGGLDDLRKSLTGMWAEICALRRQVEQQGRTLEYEYGVPPADITDARIAPRRLSRLPTVLEGETSVNLALDLENACQGRVPSAGFYANLGATEFKVVLVGVGGDTTAEHTIKAGTSIAITSFVAKLTIVPQGGQPAKYQVYLR